MTRDTRLPCVAPLVVVIALAAALTTGCTPRPTVVATPPPPAPPPDLFAVLPGADGKVGAITVTRGTEQNVLDTAYAATRITARGRLEPGRVTEQEVRDVFGQALGAQPPAPVSFILYFVFGRDELTAESQQVLSQVSAEIGRRPAAEVVVIGHTDRVGNVPQNDALSLQRAERVRRELVQVGIPTERIEVAGRGEREPLVPTEDEVAEPKNRRVEITVR